MIEAGICFAMYAYDVGFSIDLDKAEKIITDETYRGRLRHSRKSPQYFEFDPQPLKIVRDAEVVRIAGFETRAQIGIKLFDFGGALVSFEISLHGALDELIGLSSELYDSPELHERSRRALLSLVEEIKSAINRPEVSELVEDYVVYQIAKIDRPGSIEELLKQNDQAFARILTAEDETLSAEQVADTLSTRLAFGPNDVTIINWNAALLLDPDADDILAVLEYANAELLEMRLLDDRLDDALDEAYGLMTASKLRRLFRPGRLLARVAEMQLDGAFVFEGVNNAVKLLGDQYLARVYEVASQRLHLVGWDRSVIRKLETLADIYQKMSDLQATRRSEMLEWVIVILIAFEICLTLFGAGH